MNQDGSENNRVESSKFGMVTWFFSGQPCEMVFGVTLSMVFIGL